MTEILVNAVISEAKHVEPFLKLPKSHTQILKIPISAPTVDLRNIVKNHTIPKFLHTALYHSKMADTQVGDNLLKSCNIISNLLGKIWEYLRIMDPSIVIPPDAEEPFDFTSFKQYEAYDVKLTARYWAKEMYTLLDVIDNACRLAIKEQTRLALCLFEVLDQETSVEFAYNVIMFNTKVQREKGNASDTYIEFAKMFAKMIDKTNNAVLHDKIKESVLYQSLEMDNKLVKESGLSWLQKMLYVLPRSTIETWSHQLTLIGPWMSRLFIPWMKQCVGLGLFTSSYPFPRKKGPVETVGKALEKSINITFSDIQLVSVILKDLYMNRDPTESDMDKLDEICVTRTGLNLVQWAATIDASVRFQETVLVERPLEIINRDIDTWERKTKLAKDALEKYLAEKAFVDQEDAHYAIFSEYLSDFYLTVNTSKQKEELLRQKERLFENLSLEKFNLMVEFMVVYYTARGKLLGYIDEREKLSNNKSLVTAYYVEQIRKQKERVEFRKKLFLIESNKRLRRQFSAERFIGYMDWFDKEGKRLQVVDEKKFRQDTENLLSMPFKTFEGLMVFLESAVRADRVLENLEDELAKHKAKLEFRRGALAVFIFLLFGVMIFFLMQTFAPISFDTPTPGPYIPPADQTPVTVDPDPSWSSGIWGTVGAVGDWVANTRAAQAVMNRADIGLQDVGWRRFDWSGRLLSGSFWMDTIWRAGGGTVMTLVYAKVVATTGLVLLYFLWASSSALSNTFVLGYMDENFSEVWRRESLRIAMAGINVGMTLASNVLSVQTEYIENSRHLFGMAAQVLQLGPPVLNVMGRQLAAYSQSPQRTAVTDRLNQELEYYKALAAGNVPQETTRLPMRERDIVGPRVEVLADENEPAQSTEMVLYKAPAEPNYSDA